MELNVETVTPGDLSDPGIELRSLTSLALAGGFSTTSATWEALKISPFLFLWRSPALLHRLVPGSVPQILFYISALEQ